MKHVDFIILDILCLQVALDACKPVGMEIVLYRFLGQSVNDERRDTERTFPFTMTVKQAVFIVALLYLFLLQEGQNYSRNATALI